ncbi:LytTR family DNA-binding domain-containing protein [Aureisphaera galaxeae]|uniref:LytR/AlgR family response regulator transcription factor n=1 Tax=Aureisphaera galaxeae TaxID=1538023 RepID=UPI002350FA76|nr:LytTR family DNA-binding domain-containing protein [Aureisphaera galaxeae]MDC8005503.1 LytTR family DNA-binding domain-containing protein [Aureisphaera galaxeae]
MSISNSKKIILIIISLLIVAITFETFQQLYFIRRYDIVPNITFLDVLQGQSFEWIIWMLSAIVLFWFSKRNFSETPLQLSYLARFTFWILSLTFVTIVTISIVSLLRNDMTISFTPLVEEFMPFYTYRKGPIFVLGYSALAIIFHLFFLNEQLQIQVQELSELKEVNLQLYNSLKNEINDQTTILNIKIGNKRKIIPIEDILWIEADDYCVKVHLQDGSNYTMRSSLKTLETKLPTNYLRVHRKAIVNMKMAKELNTAAAAKLILNNQAEVPVSKSNLKTVMDFIS